MALWLHTLHPFFHVGSAYSVFSQHTHYYINLQNGSLRSQMPAVKPLFAPNCQPNEDKGTLQLISSLLCPNALPIAPCKCPFTYANLPTYHQNDQSLSTTWLVLSINPCISNFLSSLLYQFYHSSWPCLGPISSVMCSWLSLFSLNAQRADCLNNSLLFVTCKVTSLLCIQGLSTP